MYRKILEGRQPSESKQLDTIAAANELKVMIDGPGWKRVETFMETMSLGGHQLMQYETQNINGISLIAFFNNFIKYIVLCYENRAYNKIRNYIKITIQKGAKLAEERAKAEAREAKQNAEKQSV